LLVHPVVAADPRNVTARGEEKGHPVRIADREAPVASLRERGFQRAPRGPVRGERRAGTAAGHAGEAREGPSDAGDALAQRDVGQVQQPGDLAAAHTDVDEQGHQATGAGQRGDERVRQSRQGPGGALRRDGIGVLPPLPPRGRTGGEPRGVAHGARGPGQEARIAAVAVPLEGGEQDVLHEVLGLVRDHRAARRHAHQRPDGAFLDRHLGRIAGRRASAKAPWPSFR
jgi:hypothetical protein